MSCGAKRAASSKAVRASSRRPAASAFSPRSAALRARFRSGCTRWGGAGCAGDDTGACVWPKACEDNRRPERISDQACRSDAIRDKQNSLNTLTVPLPCLWRVVKSLRTFGDGQTLDCAIIVLEMQPYCFFFLPGLMLARLFRAFPISLLTHAFAG